MRRATAFLAFLCLLVIPFSPGASARPSIDFEQGIDTSNLLERMKRAASEHDAAAPVLEADQMASWEIKPTLIADRAIDPWETERAQMAAPGVMHNILRNYLSNHQGHQHMRDLMVDPRMDRVSVEIREPLKAEGTELTGQRDGMLPEANRLDTNDTALAEEKKEIDASSKKLDERLAEIDRQKAEHTSLCLPTHPPERHEWCVNNAKRINAIVEAYNADVKVHNGRVAAWRAKVNSHNPEWDKFVAQIRAWEKRLEDLIERIQRAFGTERDCIFRNGTSELINRDPAQSKITCNYDCCGLPFVRTEFVTGIPTQAQVDWMCKRSPLPRCRGTGITESTDACDPDAAKVINLKTDTKPKLPSETSGSK